MSLPMPRRIKDMPPLLLDSEDEKTPVKQNNGSENNEENWDGNRLNGRLPKRVWQLSPLGDFQAEGDSDKSNDGNDSFNYAILNNSFVLSTSKFDETPFKIREDCKINNYEKSSSKDTGYWDSGDSLLTELKSIKLNENSTKLSIRPHESTAETNNQVQHHNNSQSVPKFSFLDSAKNRLLHDNNDSISSLTCGSKPLQERAKKSSNRIQNFNDTKLFRKYSKDENLIITEKNSPKLLKILESPIQEKQTNKENEALSKVTFESLNKIPDMNFITPQVKSLQVLSKSNRPNYMQSISQQKSRKFIENEFKSSKILFQTPYSSSRPPIVNNSISLSLDETVKDKSNTSDNLIKVIKNLPETKNLFKSKISCDNLFNSKIEENVIDGDSDADDIKDKRIILINNKKYVILKKLGSGGSSTVFSSIQKDAKNKDEFALKIVDLKGDLAVVEGYLNETKLLAKLQGNINVVSLYEYEHRPTESVLYMVMEKGETDLQKILQSHQTDLPLYDLMNYWYQILQSVNYIHLNGVIHSDLKPPNFLMVNGRLKLIDFGIASNITYDSTSVIKFSQAGTFNYISPEALIDTSSGESPINKNQPKIKISTKSDVWSLGCILYLFVYKKTPFGHIKNINKKASAISNPNTSIQYPELPMYYPVMLLDMVKKCLIHNPKKRISVSELLKYPFNKIIPLDENQN